MTHAASGPNVIRVFRAKPGAGADEAWEERVRALSIPNLERAEGLLAWFPGRPLAPGGDYVMLTVWRDLDAVRAYAGDDWETPVLYGDEADLVMSVATEHYERFG